MNVVLTLKRAVPPRSCTTLPQGYESGLYAYAATQSHAHRRRVSPIQGRRIRLQSTTGPSVFYETYSDATGHYNFVDVPQGSYLVTELMGPAWTQTAPPTAGHSVTLQGIQGIRGLDFGNKRALILGFPWFALAPYPGPPTVYIR